MRIVHAAAEYAPLVKVGGLGEVTYGLPKALSKVGHRVTLFLPYYDVLDLSGREVEIVEELSSEECSCWRVRNVGSVEVLLVQDRKGDRFDRGCVYGCSDDAGRFLFFCFMVQSALRLMQDGGDPVDIVHLHDWHTAALAALLDGIPSVLTVHNFAYQGDCAEGELIRIPEKNRCYFECKGGVPNLLRGGLELSTALTTVSPTFARETLEYDAARGLQSILKRRREHYEGILNGIDQEMWDPHHGPHRNISPSSSVSLREYKRQNQQLLRERSNLDPLGDKPLFGSIMRLVPQKGLHLVQHAMRYISAQGGQFILLGTPFEEKVRQEFELLQKDFGNNRDVSINLHYQEDFAHQIFAGIDVFLMPSLFEPCGLTQLISFRFGTIPLVHHTGGLCDTVKDVIRHRDGTGFVFDHPSPGDLEKSIDHVMNYKKEHPVFWDSLMERVMGLDFSWGRAAHSYLNVYQRVLKCQ